MRLTYLLLFIWVNSYCQESKVELSELYPEAGQILRATYSGKLASEGSKMFAKIYKASLIDTDIIRIPSQLKNDQLVGEFILPASTAFFVIEIQNFNQKDDNIGKGFGFNVFKNSTPIPSTFFTQGYAIVSSRSLFKGDDNSDIAMALIEKEYALHPHLKEETFPYYLRMLEKIPKRKLEATMIAKEKFNQAMEDGYGEKNSVSYSYIIGANNYKLKDSLIHVAVQKYPKGAAAFYMAHSELQNIPISEAKRALEIYDNIRNNFSQFTVIQNRLLFNERLNIYAREFDLPNLEKTISEFLEIENTKEAHSYLAFKLNEIAWEYSKNDSTLSLAKLISEKALKARVKNDSLSIYYGKELDTYAYILYKLKDKKNALKYQRKAMSLINNIDYRINEHFVKYLLANNEHAEVESVSKKYILANVSSPKIDSTYHVALKSLRHHILEEEKSIIANQAQKSYLESIRQEMLNEKAPSFILKNIYGKDVSLDDYQGKVIVLDFWATWCGPCIKAFPAMKKLRNEMSSRGVEFLFISTLESSVNDSSSENSLNEKITKVLAKKEVSEFTVLIDVLKENFYETANKYNVAGIPAKVVIDGKGNIRYKSSGFSTEESLRKEMEAVLSLILEEM